MAIGDDPARPSEIWMDAWRGVLFASSRVLQIAEPDLIATAGIPLTWLDVLAQLYDAPEKQLRMQDLQQRLLFTRSGITRLVDRIEAAALVRREPVAGDRRGVLIVLTPEGLAKHREAFALHWPVLERVFAERLTPEQQRAVADALGSFWREAESAATD